MAVQTLHCLLLSHVHPATVGNPSGSQLLPTGFAGKRPHQRAASAPEASSLPAESSIPGPGPTGGQLSLPSVFPHPRQLLPHHNEHLPSFPLLVASCYHLYKESARFCGSHKSAVHQKLPGQAYIQPAEHPQVHCLQ